MPTITQELPVRPRTTSPPPVFTHTPRKSNEKTSISNTFLWTGDANGENGHVDSSDFFMTNFAAGSLQSLPTAKSVVSSSFNRDKTHSRNGSLLSVGAGSMRDRDFHKDFAKPPARSEVMMNGIDGTVEGDGTSTPLVNGATSPLQSTSPRTHVNGDRSSSDDHSTQQTPPTSVAPSPPVLDNSGLASSQQPPPSQTGNRHSSPAAPLGDSEIPHSPHSPRLVHRHTLQVPRHSSGRRSLRDSTGTNANPSEDNLTVSDRYSSTSGFRRASLSLARRTPRSIHSDIYLDEVPPDDEVARRLAIKGRRASKRRRREEEDDERVMVGTKVDQNHVNWVTAYNMLTGIRFTVSRTNAKLDRELTDADFEAKHKFSFDITGNELTPSAKYDFKFKDYAPWVFRRLRAKFQLDPADYLMSLTSKYILSELGSPGKSGSFFYFSRDYKYIIKTIHHAEHKLLRKILREYYEHIENNPNTLMSQFYGLHRVKMAYGRKIHFVVMNNLFPPHRDIHQMFDLKGSTIGRDFREDDLEKNPRATLKDLNWLRRNRHLECGPMKRDVFLTQLKRDVALLQRLKIMDYSLLVGIHDVEKGNEENLRDRTLQVFQPGAELGEDPQPNLLIRTPSRLENARKARELREMIKREKPVPMEQSAAKMPDELLDERKNHIFYSDDGGFRATHENGAPSDEIYYLGVIDCLTHYGMVKKMEHFWKGLSNNRNQISPIPPVAYGDRFLNFITAITMSKEEAERALEKQEQEQEQPVTEKPEGTRSSADEQMQKAEKEANKSYRTLDKNPEPREHIMGTVRAPSSELVGGQTSLPVVEEVGESSSTGGRSAQSGGSPSREATESMNNADPRHQRPRTPRVAPGPPPDFPPPPLEKPRLPPHDNGKAPSRGSLGSRDKDLPPLPQDIHGFPSPYPMSASQRPTATYEPPR